MIDTRQIRVGNIVLYQGKYHRWQENDYLDKYIRINGEYVGLNPEILGKCGFEKNKDGDWEYQIDPLMYLKIIMSKDGWAYPHYIESGPDNYKIIGLVRINSLHSLMNLYFVLTGEELETTQLP